MTSTENNALNVTELPKACGCHGCSQITGGTNDSGPIIPDDGGSLSAPSVTATPEQFADYLTEGFWTDVGSRTRSWDTSSDNIITYSLSGEFDSNQQTGFQKAFDTWSDVANIQFQQVGNSADITVLEGDDGRAWSGQNTGYIQGSHFSLVSNTISIDYSSGSFGSDVNDYGNYSMLTAIHEIGHSIGLGHTGNYNGSATYANDAQFINDSRSYSVMSYFQASNTGHNHLGEYAATPLIFDILAIQDIYGANNSARAGNTTYGFNATDAGSEFDFTVNVRPVVAIWDGNGTDTIDLSGWSNTQMINLNDGEFSNVAGGSGNLAIAFNARIENAVGGTGTDTIYGNEWANNINANNGDDTVYGSLGSDTLDGGAGTDLLLYTYAFSDFSITQVNSTTLQLVHNSLSFTDTASNFENFRFNGVDYTFDEIVNTLNVDAVQFKYAGDSGGSFSKRYYSDMVGIDTVTGAQIGLGGGTYFTVNRADGDTMTVTNGAAGVTLGAVADAGLVDLTLAGFETSIINMFNAADTNTVVTSAQTGRVMTAGGNDTVNVTAAYSNAGISSEFRIDTSTGNDDITYASSNGLLSALIFAGGGNDTVDASGAAGMVTIYAGSGGDDVTGGSGGDVIYGQSGTNTLRGGGGSDYISGGSGVDTIYGDDGVDYLHGGDASDTLYGGDDGDALYGNDGGDRLYGGNGDDYLNGGADNDILYGDAGNDSLYGGDGIDVLYGGANDDVLRGEAGQDTLRGEAGFDVLYGGADDDRLLGGDGIDILYGGTENDTLFGGSVDSDRLYGEEGDDILVGDGSRDWMYGGSGADVFAIEGSGRFTYDYFLDFNLTEGDTINMTDVLSGYDSGTEDINDFLLLEDRGNGQTFLWLDVDGLDNGTRWSLVSRIYDSNTLDGQDVDSLIANNDLIINSAIV